jgi:ferrous iron transport protein B
LHFVHAMRSASQGAAPLDEDCADAPALVLVGTPNVGKSALFGALTGRYATVSNYPGTTVELTRARAVLAGVAWEVIDTPGTDALLPSADDARVTRDILLRTQGATVLLVCDAKNLRRGLLLLAQLAEGGAKVVLALNMSDEAEERGLRIDAGALARELGIPVVQTVATRRKGIVELSAALGEARVPALRPEYGAVLEKAIAEAEALLPADLGLSARALALLLVGGDSSVIGELRESLSAGAAQKLVDLVLRLRRRYPRSLRFVVAGRRLVSVDSIHARAFRRDGVRPRRRRIAGWTTHPVLGIPLLAAVLFAAYEFVGVLGASVAVDFLERAVFRDRLVPLLARGLRAALPWRAVHDFVAGSDGILIGRYGLVSMGLSYGLAIVLPIVVTFFIAFSILEDSGYLPRLAVMLNRVFKAIGLNGKAVLPMILGLGCDTMATVTTRVLETRKERILVTLLLALAVPCSAQLAVILAMLASVPASAGMWFVGTLVAVVVAVGWIGARVLPGAGSDFVLELPPLRVPRAGNVLVKTVARAEWYLREALPLFVLGTAVLQVLERTGALGAIERAARPVIVNLLHLPAETAGSFLLGFLRRDYAAAGLFAHYEPFIRAGTLTRGMQIEIVVALVTVTLFLPCIANLFVLLKERGLRVGATIAAFVVPFAFATGALVNALMRRFY